MNICHDRITYDKLDVNCIWSKFLGFVQDFFSKFNKGRSADVKQMNTDILSRAICLELTGTINVDWWKKLD